MTVAPPLSVSPVRPKHHVGKVTALALRLAHAESALLALTSGQVDAIVDPSGKTYLLHPAQERLQENERRLQAVIESVADMVTVVNRAGVILSQNHASTHVLGYEPEELVGSNIFKLIHADELSEVYFAFFNVIEGFQERATAHFQYLARDGSYRVIEAAMSKLRGVSSEGVAFTLRPITSPFPKGIVSERREQPRAEDSLAKDRFLAVLSHELRTPLSSMLLGVTLLQENERFAEAQPTLAMIQRNIQQQSRLLEELGDFVAVGQHKVRVRLESIDAHEAVRFALENCGSEINAARIDVRLDLQAPENIVLADAVKLQQVMANLLRNAIKFSPSGSSISIASANDAPGALTLEFLDHGVGIAPELLPLVFDAFQQGDRSMQQAHGGLGLGMFIAKGLAEAQQGTLTAASEGRGQGARFRLGLKTAPTATD